MTLEVTMHRKYPRMLPFVATVIVALILVGGGAVAGRTALAGWGPDAPLPRVTRPAGPDYDVLSADPEPTPEFVDDGGRKDWYRLDIRNNTDATAADLTVDATCYDAADHLTGEGGAFLLDVLPHERRAVDLSLPKGTVCDHFRFHFDANPFGANP
jgi:hypothetical protein